MLFLSLSLCLSLSIYIYICVCICVCACARALLITKILLIICHVEFLKLCRIHLKLYASKIILHSRDTAVNFYAVISVI